MTDKIDTNKRRTLTGLLAAAAVPTLHGSDAADPRYAFLAPLRVNPFDAPLKSCIDVHAHFFNASDVTVEGYLEGPVAQSFGKLPTTSWDRRKTGSHCWKRTSGLARRRCRGSTWGISGGSRPSPK